MTLDFIFWLVFYSLEDVSFNIICLNVLEDIKQCYLLMWFKKKQLVTPFKVDDAITRSCQILARALWKCEVRSTKKTIKLLHCICLF